MDVTSHSHKAKNPAGMEGKSAKTHLLSMSRVTRAFVGASKKFDVQGAAQFNLLTYLGLREHHTLLDIGCGVLRGGRLFILYLLPGNYFGIEPEEWLVKKGIHSECGEDLIRIKKPTFLHDSDFPASMFGERFDFFLAQSIFTHAPKQQILRCLSQVRATMKPSSLFVATFHEGKHDYTGDTWLDPGRVMYTLSSMEQFAADVGLACKKIHWPHPNAQTWLVFGERAHLEEVEGSHPFSNPSFIEDEFIAMRRKLEKYTNSPEGRIARFIYRTSLGPRRLARRIGLHKLLSLLS